MSKAIIQTQAVRTGEDSSTVEVTAEVLEGTVAVGLVLHLPLASPPPPEVK